MKETRYGYCRCGCGQKTKIATYTLKKRNQVKGEPMRCVFGHGSKKFNGPDYEVLENGCWQWLKGISPTGYARIYGRKKIYAHRKYYEDAHGPIPEGMEIDHLCRNRACVNPSHLEPVSKTINIWRGACAKLDQSKVEELKRRRLAGESTLDLAKEYGVSRTTIYSATNGRSWNNTPRR